MLQVRGLRRIEAIPSLALLIEITADGISLLHLIGSFKELYTKPFICVPCLEQSAISIAELATAYNMTMEQPSARIVSLPCKYYPAVGWQHRSVSPGWIVVIQILCKARIPGIGAVAQDEEVVTMKV